MAVSSPSFLIYLCVLLSGFSALLLETLWVRVLSLSLGHTTLAASAVISAFMAGLAIGSFAAGPLARKWPSRNLIRLYGFVELGIALTGVFTKFALPKIGVFTVSLSGLNSSPTLYFLGPFLALLFPTFLMGLTFPLLVEWFQTEKAPGLLYGLNTLGAVLGAFCAGFVFIPNIGLSTSFIIAAASNCIAAVLAFLASHYMFRKQKQFSRTTEVIPWNKNIRLLLAVFFLTGLTSIICEIAWTRAFSLLIGSSTFAFTIMLVTFLLAIALGAFLFRLVLWLEAATYAFLSGILLLTAVAIMAYLPFFNHLNYLYVRIFPLLIDNQLLMDAARFFLCAIVMALPALLMGLGFPLILHLLIRENNGKQNITGLSYGINTVGCIAGGALASLLLIPTIGTEQTLHLCVWIYAAAAAILYIFHAQYSPLRIAISTGALALLGLAASLRPGWDPLIISSGVFLYAPEYYGHKTFAAFQRDTHANTLLSYKDGISCNVTVFQTPVGDRFLRVNGKTDASSGQDMHTQALLGLLPGLLHSRAPKNALLLGLGSGVTAGTLSTFSSIEKIDCVEIEPAVADALTFFTPINHNIRSNPRFKLTFNDGRHFLSATNEKYDLIASEPSNPWIAGVSNLFTKEAFELERAKLAPGGVFSQWFHSYSMTVDDFRLIMRTFASVFPHVMLMTSGNKDFYFLGSNEPWQIDYSRIEKTINENPQMALDLARLDLGHPFTLLSTTFLLNDTQFREMAGNGPLHLDDKPTLEFTSPRNLYSSLSQYIETEISKYRTDTLPEGLIGFNPTKKEWGLLYNLTAESYLRQQNLAGAQRAVQKALEMDPLSARAWANSGRIDNLLTKHFQAERSYRKAIELDKSYALPWFHMGMLYLEQGQEDQALQFLMEGHKRAPTDPIGTIQVANLQMKRGQFKEARALVEKAIEHPSTNPEIYASLQSLLQTIKQKSPAP